MGFGKLLRRLFGDSILRAGSVIKSLRAKVEQQPVLMLPPGYSCYVESFHGHDVKLGRVLSLNDESDVRHLRRSVSAVPDLAHAVDANLHDYLRLFLADRHWRDLYDGPHVVVPSGHMRLAAYELVYVLQIVGMYKSLSKWGGAAEFLKQLQNPTQIAPTFFEIETAAWCAARAVTQSMRLFPRIEHGGKVTVPEYLWRTSLGDLYCECKRSPIFEDKWRRRVDNIRKFLDDELQSFGASDARLDFFVERTGGAATLVSHRDATHTLEVGATAYWVTVAARLLRDARGKLPQGVTFAVMISLPTARAAQAAKEKVQSLIRQPEYANTPWIALWRREALGLSGETTNRLTRGYTRRLLRFVPF